LVLGRAYDVGVFGRGYVYDVELVVCGLGEFGCDGDGG